MSILIKAFEQHWCDQISHEPKVCACGATYAPDDKEPVLYGVFADQNLVKGCGCEPIEHLANVFWGKRKMIVGFLQAATLAFRAHQASLVASGTPDGAQDDPSESQD